MKRKMITILAACALALALPAAAWAEDTSEPPLPAESPMYEAAGNYFAAGDYINSGSIVQRDLYAAGQTINVTGNVGNDVLAAGQDITVSSDVGGSVRAAGESLTLNGATVTQNVTLAGNRVFIDTSSSVVGSYVACNEFTFSGKAKDLVVFCSSATIDGTVDGDVTINAEQVTFGPNAVVTGNAKVTATQEPTVAAGAQVKNIDYTAEQASAASDTAGSLSMAGSIIFAIVSILVCLITTLLILLVFRRNVEESATMVRTRTAALLVSGFVGLLIAPLVILLLCVLVLTLPFAGLVVLLLMIASLMGGAFTAASLSRILFPKMNRYGAACLGALIVGILSIIPFLGAFVVFCTTAYLTGYMIQAIWLNFRSAPKPEGTEPPAITTPATPVAPVAPAATVPATPAAAPTAPTAPAPDPAPAAPSPASGDEK